MTSIYDTKRVAMPTYVWYISQVLVALYNGFLVAQVRMILVRAFFSLFSLFSYRSNGPDPIIFSKTPDPTMTIDMNTAKIRPKGRSGAPAGRPAVMAGVQRKTKAYLREACAKHERREEAGESITW